MRPVDTIELQRGDHGCGACGQVLGSMQDFTRHQDVSYRRRPAIRCRAPQQLGLMQDHRGVWRSPAAIAKHEQFRARRVTVGSAL